MSSLRKHSKLLVIAASCGAIGAGASAIASAGAATSPSAATSPAAAKQGKHGSRQAASGRRRLLARAVHGDLVVATKTGFATITLDRGVVQSVTPQALTITEGTKKMTYKTVNLTIPTDARIRDNRKPAKLTDLKPGQRVLVIQGGKRTLVSARDARGA